MTQTLSLGPLSLLAEQHGPLLTITIHAPSDTTPVGKMTLTVAEWTSLVALVDCMVAAEKRHAEDRAEIERLTAEHHACQRMRALLSSIRDDFDIAVSAHDLSDPRHPSHGGQHTNGRCCSFGNVAPGAVAHMRLMRDAIDAAIGKDGGNE